MVPCATSVTTTPRVMGDRRNWRAVCASRFCTATPPGALARSTRSFARPAAEHTRRPACSLASRDNCRGPGCGYIPDPGSDYTAAPDSAAAQASATVGRQFAELHRDVLLRAVVQKLHVDVGARRHLRKSGCVADCCFRRAGRPVPAPRRRAEFRPAPRAIRPLTSPIRTPRVSVRCRDSAIAAVISCGDHAHVAAHHLPVRDHLIHHRVRHVHRNRESHAFIAAAAARQNRRVDADQFAAHVHQRSAGIALIDGRVGLDEIAIAADFRDVAAAFRADDSHGHALAQPERLTHGEHHVADAHLIRIAQGQHRQILGVDLQNRDIRLRIGADHAEP